MLGQADLKRTFPWLNIEAGDVSPEVTHLLYPHERNQPNNINNQPKDLPPNNLLD